MVEVHQLLTVAYIEIIQMRIFKVLLIEIPFEKQ